MNRVVLTESDHVSPSVRYFGECSADPVREDLATGDRHIVQSNKSAANFGWSDLCDVQGNDHGRGSHTKPDNQTTDNHLSDGIGGGLEDGANGK